MVIMRDFCLREGFSQGAESFRRRKTAVIPPWPPDILLWMFSTKNPCGFWWKVLYYTLFDYL